MDTRKWFVVNLLIVLVCAYIVIPMEKKPMPGFLKDAKINKGIDLAGGAELTYRVLFEPGDKEIDRKATTQKTVEVLETRVNNKGLKDPKINAKGDDQIVIQIPGVDRDALEDYKQLFKNAGKLELRKTAPKRDQEDWNHRYVAGGRKEIPPPPLNYIVIANDEKMSGEYAHFGEDYILVGDPPVIGGGDTSKGIKSASHSQAVTEGGSGYKIDFQLSDNSIGDFDSAARELYNENPSGLICIIMDGKIISKPRVKTDKFGGSGTITGRFDEKQARNLAIILKSGNLPRSIGRFSEDGKAEPGNPEAQTFVGPSLGQDSIRRGFTACAVAFGLVAVFMIAYYRTGGIVAVVSLLFNAVYLLAVMAFFGATLTLPGIAGIALTMGMAVDANILVYERLREELLKGKTLNQAFEAAHDRVVITIIDCHVTTLISGIVLFYFGTGPVQGFAVTLVIGILSTLYSVLIVGKIILRLLIQSGSIKEFKMGRIFHNPNYNFIKVMKPFVIVSLIVTSAAVGIFIKRGDDNFGMDFKGGTVVNFNFRDPQDIDAVRAKVNDIKGPDGLPKYDATVQTVTDPSESATQQSFLAKKQSKHYQIRTSSQEVLGLRADIQKAFAGDLSHEPFEDLPGPTPVSPNPFVAEASDLGFIFYLQGENLPLKDIETTIKKACDKFLTKDPLDPSPDKMVQLALLLMPDSPKGLTRVRVVFTKEDAKDVASPALAKTRAAIKKLGEPLKIGEVAAIPLSASPFTGEGNIGPAVASELKNSSVWALIISWALMIVYIAFRFASWRFGIAGVIALIHDGLVAIGFMSLCGWIIPKAWGLSFEMNMTFVAAILTVIGYSINDTVIVYDRIRENLGIMKKESFAEIINASTNQMLGRTILTSFTVFITCVILYTFTMTSPGGISEFSFPMLIGVITGTYSSIYIASAIVLWWYRGAKPQIAK